VNKTDRVGEDNKPAWLVNAGAAVGLVAGIVALGYVLGAGVIAVRLFVDKYWPDEVAGVIGELPREFVITLGFIEGLAVAVSVGVVVGLVAAGWDWLQTKLTFNTARYSAWIFALGCYLFMFGHEGWRPVTLAIFLPSFLLSVAAGSVAAHSVSRAATVSSTASDLGTADSNKRSRDLGFRVAVAVTAIGMPLCVMFGPIVGFPDARVCVRGSDKPLTGSLVADTKESVVLLRRPEADREDDSDRTVDTIPADLVARLDFGDIKDVVPGLPPCDAAVGATR
jgi:hypothetical protein